MEQELGHRLLRMVLILVQINPSWQHSNITTLSSHLADHGIGSGRLVPLRISAVCSAMVVWTTPVLPLLAGCALGSSSAKCSGAKRSDLKSPYNYDLCKRLIKSRSDTIITNMLFSIIRQAITCRIFKLVQRCFNAKCYNQN